MTDPTLQRAGRPLKPRPTGQDELYAYWFRCRCGHDMILRGSNFCPGCGRPLNWEGVKNE